MSTPKIELRGVHKSFGAKKVLCGIDIGVAEGESLVIIGGSGSGKSVTLKCILGLVKPDKGQILIDGKDTSVNGNGTLLRDQIGMLFQGGALFDSMKVWENVAFRLLHNSGTSRDEAYKIAIEKLASVGLEERVGQLLPAELSGGMQKRVSLARAIATNPAVLFFDEPTTGLDPITAATINDLIRNVTRDMGATAISITHDMASVRAIADKVAMIYEGKIIWHDTVQAMETTDNAYVDQFIHGKADGPIKTIKAA